ncbi:MAG: hypothetical protein M0R30_10025 [Methanoregula sp.]|jgi:hypothetical protein|uniref:hypothetical protein n=1 Tax=Methanoregula sp. TaxID=2052170 RepID=UPI0025D2C21B|nr:hypothetical protein [Methanoregula sp.]MCK9631968.1 hypothetical protein [Methanoregula sp.]
MGFLNSIKDIIVQTGENIAESQERRNLRIKIKGRILHRFSTGQLRSLCNRYGGGPREFNIDPFTSRKTQRRLSDSDFIEYADFHIKSSEVKDFAIANKIAISDIISEEKELERNLEKKWNSKKKKTESTKTQDKMLREVIDAIEKFEPSRNYHSEQGYHTELQGWLRAHFQQAKVEHQTGSSRPDIVIDSDIAIEVKGPTKSQDLKTIADKCNRYTIYWKSLIIVLFEVDVNERFYTEWEKGIVCRYPEVTIIRK